ncbi:MAG: hypothetical protein JJE47_01930 [Acidimicrobiia bacterium]|nr:hypothetical protein [Acidimicrobiia bacterium]
MNVFETIKRNRRIVMIGAGAVYLITAFALVAGISSGGIGVYQAIALAVAFTLPATLALLSLNQRPSLLTVAWMAALVAGFAVIELSPVWIVVAIAWGFASRNRPRPAVEARWMTWGRPLLALMVAVPVFILFMHLDPVCTTTYADGHTETVIGTSGGFASGWQFGSSYSTSSGSASSPGGTGSVSENCDSNTVVWWEALLSIAASAAVVGVARRWPTSESLKFEPASPAS